ncbi:hypothetical protein [Lyngbya sp. PCC 8106]|uniref:hypothetical protein n=1 Tax=Lyngbya sp. (strain PCC 8106) TaxID=313612 RepID=UPI0000EAA8EB|nr:hypothetical protein [Lyngbya sp. PCC 8106]EAW34371.1 hypothetical protein L8106_12195 [Lyngbya sp. PCC 8106]
MSLFRRLKQSKFLGWIVAALLLAVTLFNFQQKQVNSTPSASLLAEQTTQNVAIVNPENSSNSTQNSQIETIAKSNACTEQSPFDESVRFALRGSNLAQTAKTKQQWDEVARNWVQAVAWMQAVPPNSPKRAFAEKKVVEYMRNLTYSQQQAAKTQMTSQFPSFDSELLDEQLQLYLSYLSTVGKPDILIVGSSRALQGIDPREMKQALAAKGYQGLKIFNFGVNGATAQVVDYVLTDLLTPNQLPKMIVWADGVRALNSGRIDRTYQSIIASEGHKRLASGVRPQLTSTQSDNTQTCYQLPQSCSAKPKWVLPQAHQDQQIFDQDFSLKNANLKSFSPVAFNSATSPQVSPLFYRPSEQTSATLISLNTTIDANGFLSAPSRYNPYTYYQQRPYVSGRYDGDYRAFNLAGEQARAFSSVIGYVKTQNIPLVFVNLPLTDDYLDSYRWWAEQEFQNNMQRLSQEYGFIFIDLSEAALTRYEYFVDPSHLNRYGAQVVAQKLAGQSAIPWPRSQ